MRTIASVVVLAGSSPAPPSIPDPDFSNRNQALSSMPTTVDAVRSSSRAGETVWGSDAHVSYLPWVHTLVLRRAVALGSALPLKIPKTNLATARYAFATARNRRR